MYETCMLLLMTLTIYYLNFVYALYLVIWHIDLYWSYCCQWHLFYLTGFQPVFSIYFWHCRYVSIPGLETDFTFINPASLISPGMCTTLSQNWLSTDLIYFQILITVLLFGIFVEYKIQEIWKRFKKEP